MLSLVLKFTNDSGILHELQICIFCPAFTVSCCQHSQLGGNEISSLALVGDPAEKGAREWEADQMKSWKAGRKLFKKIRGGDTGMCCILFGDTGLFPGKSITEEVCLSTAFVS